MTLKLRIISARKERSKHSLYLLSDMFEALKLVQIKIRNKNNIDYTFNLV